MRVSRERVAENRSRILAAAGRLFRARGFEGVTVAEVMKEAGLTHGGFYGYFRSKDDLIAAALAEMLVAPPRTPAVIADYAARYLSPDHRDDRAGGCPVAALGTEAIRQSPEARAMMTEGLRRQIAQLGGGTAGTDDGARRQAAIGSWSAMVGAMILARLCDDPQLSDDLLSQTLAWIGRDRPSVAGE